jgi:hypothetical protein
LISVAHNGSVIEAGRGDLIGGCDGLIPAQPPKEAIEARRQDANADHYPTVANPARGEQTSNKDYRPGRTPQRRQDGNRKGKSTSRPRS